MVIISKPWRSKRKRWRSSPITRRCKSIWRVIVRPRGCDCAPGTLAQAVVGSGRRYDRIEFGWLAARLTQWYAWMEFFQKNFSATAVPLPETYS